MPTARTHGIDTYYERFGDGPAVVLLHGAYSDHRVWAELARPLAEDHEVVVYDLRGHGRTGGSPAGTYTVDTFADDLHALLGELDLAAPAVCGFSLGGMIVQRYVASAPGTIAGWCSVGAVSADPLSWCEWVERRLLLGAVPIVGDLVGRDTLMGTVMRFNAWRDPTGDPGDLDARDQLREEHAADYPAMEPGEGPKVRDAIATWVDATVDYAAVEAPGLVLYGDRESETMARQAAHLGEVVPDCEVREVPGAGHNSHVDNPEFVIEALREFLGRVS